MPRGRPKSKQKSPKMWQVRPVTAEDLALAMPTAADIAFCRGDGPEPPKPVRERGPDGRYLPYRAPVVPLRR